jgi:hypothetical protein
MPVPSFVAIGLLCTLLAALFVPAVALAAEQASSTGTLADASRWTLSTEGIVLDRSGGVNRTLVARVPGDVPFIATAVVPGAGAFNSNQFQQGFSAGPKVTLIYHGDSGLS